MNIKLARRQVGQRYFKEALSASKLSYNRSRDEWLKIVKSVRGKKPNGAAAENQLVDTLHALVMCFRSGRADRVRRRTRQPPRWGSGQLSYGGRDQFFKPLKRSGDAAIRSEVLRELRKPRGRARVEEFCLGVIRKWLSFNAYEYSGITTYDARIGDGEPGVSLLKSRGARYGGSARQFSKIDAQHRVNIRPDWFSTVYMAGLFNAGGMLTLSASPVAGSNPEAFAASWVVRKGYQLSVEQGYIVCADGTHYHGSMLRAAKGAMSRARNENAQKLDDQRLLEMVKNYQDHPQIWDFPVTADQARAAGNCRSGVASWVSRHFPEQTTARLADVLKAGSGDQELRVRRVALYVLRKALRRSKEKPHGESQAQAAQG